jgi:hypothetical protein
MQQLTRERGFGLGSWLDRFVEWTLFGVDEEWSSTSPDGGAENPAAFQEDAPDNGEEQQTENAEGDHHNSSLEEDNHAVITEKPGDKGGWADATWFFRVVKNAVV